MVQAITIMNAASQSVGEHPLPAFLLAGRVNEGLLYQVVAAHLYNRHTFTASSKGQSEVARSTRKIYRQKGTGNARHGSLGANIFVGGGKSFGPHPRLGKSRALNAQMKKAALVGALKRHVAAKTLRLVDEISFPTAKTKVAQKFLQDLGVACCLVVLDHSEPSVIRALRNLKDVKVVCEPGLGVLDLMRYPTVLMTTKAMLALEARIV